MPKPIQLDKPCEVCGENKWWDNTESKKSAKHPDFRCANKDCKGKDGYPGSRWLPKGGAPKGEVKEPQGGRITGDDTTPDERGEKVFSWEALTYTYGKLYEAVWKVVRRETPDDEVVDQNAVQAGVATLLIQGEKAHIPLLHPRKPVVAEKPKAKEVVVPEGAEGFEPVEEDLPW